MGVLVGPAPHENEDEDGSGDGDGDGDRDEMAAIELQIRFWRLPEQVSALRRCQR